MLPPKPEEINVKFWIMDQFHYNQWRAHSHIWINPKITNYVVFKYIYVAEYSKLEHEQEE